MRLTAPGALLAATVLIRAGGFPYDSAWGRGVWIVAGLACLVSLRWGAAAVAVVTWITVFSDYYNHVLFIAWMSTSYAIFTDYRQLRLVVRSQLSIVYGFAGISKISPVWLSGAALTSRGVDLPEGLLVPVAVAAVLVEAYLAVALWLPPLRAPTLVVGGGMHVGFWLMMGDRLITEWGLLPFNLLAFGLLVWSTSDLRSRGRSPRGRAT